jgi:hypothetical protein
VRHSPSRHIFVYTTHVEIHTRFPQPPDIEDGMASLVDKLEKPLENQPLNLQANSNSA